MTKIPCECAELSDSGLNGRKIGLDSGLVKQVDKSTNAISILMKYPEIKSRLEELNGHAIKFMISEVVMNILTNCETLPDFKIVEMKFDFSTRNELDITLLKYVLYGEPINAVKRYKNILAREKELLSQY